MTNDHFTRKYKSYKKEFGYSYTIGAYSTVELLSNRPEKALAVYIHSKHNDSRLIESLCGKKIEVIRDDKVFTQVHVNDKCYVLGVFQKYETVCCKDNPHIVLVNPSDMGNLGTIIRTVAGLGYKDLAVITPAADIYNPKTIRASMGALFRINFQHFETFKEYEQAFGNRTMFPFMLDGEIILRPDHCPKTKLFSLVFGNESTGLDQSFSKVGPGIKIPQTGQVDSLNLSVAVGIGAYMFSLNNGMLKD